MQNYIHTLHMHILSCYIGYLEVSTAILQDDIVQVVNNCLENKQLLIAVAATNYPTTYLHAYDNSTITL